MLEYRGNDYLHNRYDENELQYMVDLKNHISNISEIKIPEDGFILKPGKLYLIATKETIGSDYYIPMITGRSSLARVGVSVHQEAGFGDIGFKGNWTLELSVVQPLVIYPNMKICQISYNTITGDTDIVYNGKYQNSKEILPSKLYEDFK